MARHVWHGLLGSCTLEAKRSGCPAPLRTSHAQEQTGPQDLFLDATLHASPGAMPAKQQGTCRKMASRVAEPRPRVSPSSRSAFCTLCRRPGGRGRGRAGRSRSVVQGVGGETARARVHRRRASPPCLGAPELKQQAQQRCLLWPSLHLALLRSAPRTSLPRLPHPRHPQPPPPHPTPPPAPASPHLHRPAVQLALGLGGGSPASLLCRPVGQAAAATAADQPACWHEAQGGHQRDGSVPRGKSAARRLCSGGRLRGQPARSRPVPCGGSTLQPTCTMLVATAASRPTSAHQGTRPGTAPPAPAQRERRARHAWHGDKGNS